LIITGPSVEEEETLSAEPLKIHMFTARITKR
jgi:hypothetical protein